jgi:hypothetical protein
LRDYKTFNIPVVQRVDVSKDVQNSVIGISEDVNSVEFTSGQNDINYDLNFSAAMNNDVSGEIIDVFPYNGDDTNETFRKFPSSYKGKLRFESIDDGGENIYTY